MIQVSPLDPVYIVDVSDRPIARFTDSEWRVLIELARRYGFEPPDIENYQPRRQYDNPIEIGTEGSQALWEAVSAMYNNNAVPSVDSILRVKQLVDCAQIGAEQRGIEIRRIED